MDTRPDTSLWRGCPVSCRQSRHRRNEEDEFREEYDINARAPSGSLPKLETCKTLHGSGARILYTLGGIESTASVELSVEAFGPEIADGDTWDVFDSLTYDRRASVASRVGGGDTFYHHGRQFRTIIQNNRARLFAMQPMKPLLPFRSKLPDGDPSWCGNRQIS